jgi:hypothetical protein
VQAPDEWTEVPSVEVRPRRSIAPVLKKVFVELLTITQPPSLRCREQQLLSVERLSDRRPCVVCAFRNGHSHQKSNHRSEFDRSSPTIPHDRLPSTGDPGLDRAATNVKGVTQDQINLWDIRRSPEL